MMRGMRTFPIASLLLALWLSPALAEELRILAWNVESGTPRPDDPSEGSDPETIAGQLTQLADYDLVGLSEVRPAAAKQFVDALSAGAGETFLSVNTATGMDDRLVLVWNSKRLQLLESYELHRFGDWMLNSLDDKGNWRHRSPLLGHFRDRDTGAEFLGMVNHLA